MTPYESCFPFTDMGKASLRASVGLQFLHETLFNSPLTGEVCYGGGTSLGEGCTGGGFAGVETLLLGMVKPPFVTVKVVWFHASWITHGRFRYELLYTADIESPQ